MNTPRALSLSNTAGNYIEGDIPGLPQSNSPFSMEAWVKMPQAASAAQSVINYGSRNVGQRRTLFINILGQLCFVGEYNDVVGTTNVRDGQWHHLAITFNGTIMRLYVDGVVDSTGYKTLATFGTNIRIGRAIGDGEEFNGQIDEVRVWNYARTSSDINTFMRRQVPVPQSGLVAYYQFNQGIPEGNNFGIFKIVATVGSNLDIIGLLRTGNTSNFVTYTGPAITQKNCTGLVLVNGYFQVTYLPTYSIFNLTCNVGYVLSGCSGVICQDGQDITLGPCTK